MVTQTCNTLEKNALTFFNNCLVWHDNTVIIDMLWKKERKQALKYKVKI